MKNTEQDLKNLAWELENGVMGSDKHIEAYKRFALLTPAVKSKVYKMMNACEGTKLINV